MSRTSIFGFGDQGNTVIRTSYGFSAAIRTQNKGIRNPSVTITPRRNVYFF